MANVEGGFATGLGIASPFLSAVPYIGPILSAAASIGSGLLEKDAAKKQAEQAANLRKQGLNLPLGQLRPEYAAKLRADQFAAQGDMPGLATAQDQLQKMYANHLKTIRESSPNGEATLAAMNAALGQTNTAANDLSIKNAAYKADLNKDVRSDLWNIGDKMRELELQRLGQQKDIYSQANNLEAAATANKQTAYNTIFGSIGSTATALSNQYNTDNTNRLWMDFLKSQAAKNTGGVSTTSQGLDNNYGSLGNGQPNMMNQFQLMQF